MERWCLTSLKDHLGPERHDADTESRLASLAYLSDTAARVEAAMQTMEHG
jgi:hypothetical protein